MGDWGVKVSQPGFDVKTTAAKNLAFTSQYTSFKVQKTSLGGVAPTIVVPKATAGPVYGLADVTIPHGLTYAPSFQIWATDSSGQWRYWTSEGDLANTLVGPFYSGTDTTNLNIHFANGDTSQAYTVSYHYIIMLDAA